MSNEKTTPGTKLNYMYGEMVSRYLTNLDDWVEYPSTHATALSYTNADGKRLRLEDFSSRSYLYTTKTTK
mgnify:CR=1 FL=1